MEQYKHNKRNNEKGIVMRLDHKSDVKRKYKLLIESNYIYETDSPSDIARVIDGYVNYT